MWEWLATTKLGHAVIGLLACIVVGAALFGYGWMKRGHYDSAACDARVAALQVQIAQANVKAIAAARASETAQAHALNAAAESYERGKIDAQQDADSVIAGLRAGNLRLREQWREAGVGSVPASGSTVGGPDAAERSREESAGRIIGAAEQCDAQVSGLQQVIRSYLRIINGSAPELEAIIKGNNAKAKP